MGMGFAPTWFSSGEPPPLLHKTTHLTTDSIHLAL